MVLNLKQQQPVAAEAKEWEVISGFWDGRIYRAVGDIVTGTEAEMRYLKSGGNVRLKAAASAQA